jgi:hypothetical protein
MSSSANPALSELADHLTHRGINADPREIAAVILEIVRDKIPGHDARGPLVDWIHQLAVDTSQ